MTEYVLPEHAGEVLYLFGFPEGAESLGGLWWRNDGGRIRFFVTCSDLFLWATADCEALEPEDMPLLRQVFADLKGLDATYWLAELFACRKRGHRPMTQFKLEDPDVMALFEACGPVMVDPLEVAYKAKLAETE